MQKSRTLGSRASRPLLAFATLSEASIGSLTPHSSLPVFSLFSLLFTLSSVLGRSGLRPSLVRGDSPRNAPLKTRPTVIPSQTSHSSDKPSSPLQTISKVQSTIRYTWMAYTLSSDITHWISLSSYNPNSNSRPTQITAHPPNPPNHSSDNALSPKNLPQSILKLPSRANHSPSLKSPQITVQTSSRAPVHEN